MGVEPRENVNAVMNKLTSVKRDYVDRDGIQRRVLIPPDVTDYGEGVPLSLDVDVLFRHCGIDFVRDLSAELWARGLIEPADYLKAGAAELITAALRSVVKRDALDILALARESRK